MRLKCVNCGFVNFLQETSCKRCKSALGQALECHNIWRDGKRLVISISEHLMPKRCLKCGTADYVDREVLELTYTPLPAYFTILLNFTYWTEIELYGFFCTSHRRFAERQPFLLLPNFLVVAGALSVFASLMGDSPGLRMLLFFGGGGMLGLGILFIRLALESIKIVKRNKKYIWIKGVDQNLLAQLEDFAASKR
jgi:predicted nucleic-acid-binding Zn-ribbon protein